ncbi:MAG: hypothetical protein IJ752_03115 [Alphaproteobacteria bacterium]|nr:hypothetical protein [Alphaproteobacteria bacterium]
MNSPFLRLAWTLIYLYSVVSLPAGAVKCAAVFALIPSVLLFKIRVPLRFWLPVFIPVLLLALGNLLFSPPIFAAVLLLKGIGCCLSISMLTATTRIEDILAVLNTLKCPRYFLFQLFFICRYLSLISGEATALLRSFRLKTHRRLPKITEWKFLSGALLLRCLDRSDKIAQAMTCRGFQIETAPLPSARIRLTEIFIALTALALCLILRGLPL